MRSIEIDPDYHEAGDALMREFSQLHKASEFLPDQEITGAPDRLDDFKKTHAKFFNNVVILRPVAESTKGLKLTALTAHYIVDHTSYPQQQPMPQEIVISDQLLGKKLDIDIVAGIFTLKPVTGSEPVAAYGYVVEAVDPETSAPLVKIDLRKKQSLKQKVLLPVFRPKKSY